ncbi:family 16 glycosylhydrolase [Plantactinospora sp. B24E8]|uniref:family 16 glycosylhydrolase n=1 Tax=Plantactinospora sp. B24E8 TaxID=3153567 RepID=UPI00325F1244
MRTTRGWSVGGLAATTMVTVLLSSATGPARADQTNTRQASGSAAAAATTATFGATADTTYTPVSADGDNGVKTTLASCPQSCEGNPNGERQPALAFTVQGLPANATNIRAALELYSWQAFSAGTTVHRATGSAAGPGTWANRPTLGAALATRASVAVGYNSWDVSTAVTGNGDYTFALRQSTYNNRVYWPSREHQTTSIRPRLVVSYDTAVDPWQLVWSDEFNETALDTAKWDARNNAYTDYDLPCITNRPENVFVSGGNLTLRVRKEQYACGGGGTKQYTTAYLATDKTNQTFTYGRFEMRAKSPTGPTNSKGLWPAFWMRPQTGGNGEIDVVELQGGAQYYRTPVQAIFYSYQPQVKQDHRYAMPTGHPADGFHTYTTEWEPDAIRWYVDGVQVWERTPATTPWFDEVFHKPYHLRLNFQVGGWLGDPDATTVLPADFQVDYIRVYQRTS